MARWGKTRSGSGWAFTGLVVGIGEPSGREVSGTRLAATRASPNRPSAITACARTRGEGSARAARNGAGLDAAELRLAVGQRPECELADGVVADELPQDAVRPDAIELLECKEGRNAPVQGLGRIGLPDQ